MSEFVPRLRPIEETATARTALAKRLFDIGRRDEALEELDVALHDNPELSDAHYVRGLIHFAQEDYEQAAAGFRTAVRLDASFAGGWMGLARTLRERGDLSGALRAVNRSLRADRGQNHALVLKAELLAELGRHDESDDLYRAVLRRDPNDTDALLALGRRLTELGQAGEAVALLRRLQALRPLGWEARVAYADALLAHGDVRAAEHEYLMAISLDRTQALPQLRLGILYMDRDRFAEATVTLQNAVGLDPKLTEGHIRLGRIYIRESAYRAAREALRAALAVAPDSQEAAQLLERVEAALAAPQEVQSAPGTND